MPRRRDESANSEGGATGFDSRVFVELWRRVEPQLRQRVLRFDVTEDVADDVLAEVALRMVRAKATAQEDRQFFLLADAISRRLMLDRLRLARTEPDPHGLDPRPAESDDGSYYAAPPAADEEEALDGETRIVLRMAMRARIASLSAHDRRAIALILRGGPYSGVERIVMYRARPRLREAFEDLLGGVLILPPAVARAGRWRRSRFAEPHPLVPLLAAASSALTLGGFAVSGAAPGPVTQAKAAEAARPMWPAAAAGRASMAATNDLRSSSVRPVPVRVSPVGRGGAGKGGTAAPVSLSFDAMVPRPDRQGSVVVSVETDEVAGHPVPAWSRHSVTLECNTEARRAVCGAVRPIAGD